MRRRRERPRIGTSSTQAQYASGAHAHRPLTRTVPLNLDPRRPIDSALARIPATKDAALYPTAHSCATSDTNGGESISLVQSANQSDSKNETSTAYSGADTPKFEPVPLEEPIRRRSLVPHAHRPPVCGPRVAPLTPCAGSHPGYEWCGMVLHGAFESKIQHERGIREASCGMQQAIKQANHQKPGTRKGLRSQEL